MNDRDRLELKSNICEANTRNSRKAVSGDALKRTASKDAKRK